MIQNDKKKCFILVLFLLLVSLPFVNAAKENDFIKMSINDTNVYTHKDLVDSRYIVGSDKTFYGSSEGQITMKLYLADKFGSGNYTFGLRTRSKNITVKSVGVGKSPSPVLSVASKSYDYPNWISLDGNSLTEVIIVIEFDPNEIGIREEFDVVVYNDKMEIVAVYDPFVSGFTFRQELTLNTNGIGLGANVTTDQTVWVHIVPGNTEFWTNHSFSDFNGITFTQSDETTELDWDVEDFDTVNEDANIWVEYVENFDSVTDSTMWMYYDGPNTNHSDGSAAYPSTYTSVWHMNQTTGSDMFDSTSNDFDLNNTNTPTLGEDSQIGDGVKYERTNNEFSTNNDLLNDGYSQNSVSMWVKKPSTWDSGQGSNNELFYKSNAGSGNGRMSASWRESNGAINFDIVNDGGTLDQIISSKTSWAAETWFHLVFVFSATDNNMNFYVNGSTTDGGTREDSMDAISAGSSTDFFFSRNGAFPAGQIDADQTLDEMKVFRNVELSPDEVKILFNSESDNLITFGAQQTDLSANFTTSLNPAALDPENSVNSVIVTLTDTSTSGTTITDWNYFIDGSQFYHSTVDGDTTREITSAGDFNFTLIITSDTNLNSQKDTNVIVSNLVQAVDINSTINTFTISAADVNFGVTFTGSANAFNWGFPGDQNILTRNAQKTFTTPGQKTVCVTIANSSDVNKTVCENFLVGRVIVKKPLNIVDLEELTPFNMDASANPPQSFNSLSADTNFFFFSDINFSSSISVDVNAEFFSTSRLFDFTTVSNDFVFQSYLVPVNGNLTSIIFTIDNINQKQTIPGIKIVSETVIGAVLVEVESKISDITGTAEFHFEIGREYVLSFFDSDGELIFSGTLNAKSLDATLFAALAQQTLFNEADPTSSFNLFWDPVVSQVNIVDGNVTISNTLNPFNTIIGDINVFVSHISDSNIVFQQVFTLDSSDQNLVISYDINVSGFDDDFPLKVNVQVFDVNGLQILNVYTKNYSFKTARVLGAFEALKEEFGAFPVMFFSIVFCAGLIGLLTLFSPTTNNNWIGVIAIISTAFFVIITWIPVEAWLVSASMTIGMILWRDREQ